MHQKSRSTLEYQKIIQRVAGHCDFSASRELAEALEPSSNPDVVRRQLAFTTEARRLLDARPEASIRSAHDVRPQVQLALRSGMLMPDQLLEIQQTLHSSAFLNRLLSRLDETFPLLRSLGVDLPVRTALDDRISACISEDGAVRDSASPRLQELRQQVRTAQQRLQERLGGLVNEFRDVLQDALITTREGRYVLPVRAEARSKVRGIVHDQSSSGATVFVEPLVIVEMNNRLRELESSERAEVQRILVELSGFVGTDAPYLTLMVELLAEIDFHFAKARYSQALRANPATLNTEGHLRLVEARHPLLTGAVVPLDFRLGQDFMMVVITGPNTGGKTVALKTVGLLALMTQAGLHIPADERSVMPVYHDVLADIGDEQSIEQSLSTFSSHMTRIIEIMKIAGAGSLVLLDELGAGTDPSEGSALARAILLELLEHGVECVATTHYSELKAFAHEQAGVTNASVEFNVETLSPTYRLQIGLPGRSNALAIAARLGLDASVIERARGMSDTASVRMEDLLGEIQRERQTLADERFEASMVRAALEDERQQLRDRVAGLEAERVETERLRVQVLNTAREEARKHVQQVRSEVGRLRASSRNERISEDVLAEVRAQLHKVEENSAPLVEPPRPPSTRRKTRIPEERAEPDAYEDQTGDPQVGDLVRIESLGQVGEVLALPEGRGEAEVQVGAMKLRVKTSDLRRLSRRQARAEVRQSYVANFTPAPAPEEQLDLRGQRAEEAVAQVDRYLHDAFMGGLSRVRIVHGRGTGAVRQAVRELLARHPLVQSFASPEQREGGDGVTVVQLNH